MNKIRSRTKSPVKKADLTKIVEHHFGIDSQIISIEELGEGYYSIAYSIEISELDYNIVIKFAPPSLDYQLIYEQKGIETEVEFIKILEKRSSRAVIPYPELLFEDSEGEVIGRPYFIMKKFEGLTWDKIKKKLTKEEIDSFREQLGKIQKRINEIKGENFGSIVAYNNYPIDKSTWGETVLEMFRNLLRDSRRFKTRLTRKDNRIFSTIEKHVSLLNEVKEPRLVHWDLWEGNATVVQKEGKWIIEGIFDFERALWGDPLMEMLFRKVWRYEPFLKGYGEEILKQPGAEIRNSIYSLYLLMIFIIESSARNYKLYLKLFFKFIGWRYLRKEMRFLKK